jgi:hypothetical protein
MYESATIRPEPGATPLRRLGRFERGGLAFGCGHGCFACDNLQAWNHRTGRWASHPVAFSAAPATITARRSRPRNSPWSATGRACTPSMSTPGVTAGMLCPMLALGTAKMRPLFWSFVVGFNLVGATDLIVDYYHAIRLGLPTIRGATGCHLCDPDHLRALVDDHPSRRILPSLDTGVSGFISKAF